MLDPNQIVELKLTAQELQVVISALGEMPYKFSSPVVDKIRTQVTEAHPDAFGPMVSPLNGIQQAGVSVT